jgi:hypothetical protein
MCIYFNHILNATQGLARSMLDIFIHQKARKDQRKDEHQPNRIKRMAHHNMR